MKNKEEIMNEAGQQIQIILDNLWANEEISRQDYVEFLSELIEIIKDDKEQQSYDN
jgi:hypothetical protein